MSDPDVLPPHVEPAPHPQSVPAYLSRLVRNPLSALTRQVYTEPYTLQSYGLGRIMFVTDPWLIKAVLLDEMDSFDRPPQEERVAGPLFGRSVLLTQGAEWKWQRQAAAPAFRHADIVKLAPWIAGTADRTIAAWSRGEGEIRDVFADMLDATYLVISRTLLPGGGATVERTVEREMAAFLKPYPWKLAYALFGLPGWVPHPGSRRMAAAASAIRREIAGVVAARRQAGRGNDDFLSRLVSAKDPETGRQMGDENLVDNIVTYLVAGHETTALALAWSLYLLALAPAWQTKVADEVLGVVGQRPLQDGDLDKLILTRQVIKEAMRLYPPVPEIIRKVARPVTLGGVSLRVRDFATVSIYAAQRHLARWPDPGRFDPDRFSPANEKQHVRYQFMPFGAGPRTCIGATFAMVEATALLARFVAAARFELAPGVPPPPPVSRLTLRPRDGIALRVVMR